MPSFPIRDVFAPIGWIFLVLLAVNVLLFVLLVVLREQWTFFQRRRKRIAVRLSPVVERLVAGRDVAAAVAELRTSIATLDRQERPVAAWLLRDLSRDLDDEAQARLREIFVESGAVALAERSTRRWMPWRRALACETLGTMGAARSVPVLVERLADRRSEVRSAAARALGAIGSPDAAPELTSIFLARKAVPTGVAYDALRGLGSAGGEAFRRGLESGDPTVRVTSCFGVAAQPDADAARARLARVLVEDENARVRNAAAKALGTVGGTRAPDALVEAAGASEVQLRREAVRALGSFDDAAVVGLLADAAGSPDREIALRAAESLLALGEKQAAGPAARAALAQTSSWSVDYARTISELAA